MVAIWLNAAMKPIIINDPRLIFLIPAKRLHIFQLLNRISL